MRISRPALNKIYFGERQRLSCDLDIERFDLVKAKKLIGSISEQSVQFKKAARFIYKGVQIGLTKAIEMEKPKIMNAKSLLNFFWYPIASVNVPSYSLELLMAKKAMALLSRMVNKDIYDSWTGLKLMSDKKKFSKYLELLSVEQDLDIPYMLMQLRFYSNGGFIKDMSIDALNYPSSKIMVNDIFKEFSDLGFYRAHFA